ncbi:MAG: hypothetical protein ACTS73_00475 [Arsenophonus sp. NEOnobi-MAG3]
MADGIYISIRQDNRFCLLVIIGGTEHRRKELLRPKMLIESKNRT